MTRNLAYGVLTEDARTWSLENKERAGQRKAACSMIGSQSSLSTITAEVYSSEFCSSWFWRLASTFHMSSKVASAAKQLRQSIVQVLAPHHPFAAECVPFNEGEVDSAHFFIDENLPGCDYALVQIAALSDACVTN